MNTPPSLTPAILAAGLCLAGGLLAHLLTDTPLAPLIFWPPAGLALGATWRWGWRALPGAALGTGAAALLGGLPWPAAILVGFVTAAATWLAVILLRGAGFDARLARIPDLARLALLGGALPGALGALVMGLALGEQDWLWEAPPAQKYLAAWLAPLAAVLVFTPLLLPRQAPERVATGGRLEIVLALVSLMIVSVLLARPGLVGLPEALFRPYPILPFLVWLALRADPRHVALGLAWSGAVAASVPGWGRGPLFGLLPDVLVLPIHGVTLVTGLSTLALATITQARARAEQALRDSNERFVNILDLTHNCLWETDSRGRFTFVGQHAERLFGRPAGEMLGKPPAEALPDGLAATFDDLFQRACPPGLTLAHTAGEPVADTWLETSCLPRVDGQGRFLGWQGITHDIGERVRLQSDLADTHRRFQQLAENIQEVFWISDRELRFHYLSPQCEKVVGIAPETLYADPQAWLDLVDPDDRRRVDEARLAGARGEAVELEFRLRHPRKGTRWVWARTFPFEGNGDHDLAAGILEDITDRKRAEQAHLAEALAQRDALIREVHHRIKNNLQTVVGLLRREAGKYPEARQAIEAAISQVQSVAVVHGLHGRVARHDIMLCELLPAIIASVSELTGVPVVRDGVREGCGELRIKDSETVAVALILNELLTNAVKHARQNDGQAPPLVTILREGSAGRIRMVNAGRLPDTFDFARGVGLGTGLGLVRALAPAPGMRIGYRQTDGHVEVEIWIEPPVVAPSAPDQPEFGTNKS